MGTVAMVENDPSGSEEPRSNQFCSNECNSPRVCRNNRKDKGGSI